MQAGLADYTPFKKILCANRGEIAIRIFRAGRELGLRTVAVYSAVDRLMPHRYKVSPPHCHRAPLFSRSFRPFAKLNQILWEIFVSAPCLLCPQADESYEVGNPEMTPVGCYLDIESVIKIAKKHKVDAIHPGYGFLSENAEFARQCELNGITFIGPRYVDEPSTLHIVVIQCRRHAESPTSRL